MDDCHFGYKQKIPLKKKKRSFALLCSVGDR
jgi:hypothetical protein